MQKSRGAISFVATPRLPSLDHLKESPVVGGEGILVGLCLRRRVFQRSLRHDLPPEETSQIVRTVAGQIAVGHQDIFPAVIIHVGKQRAPGPTSHGHAGAGAHVAKCAVTNDQHRAHSGAQGSQSERDEGGELSPLSKRVAPIEACLLGSLTTSDFNAIAPMV